jgi:malonate-semialdehyde dehydrogenase (acetylating) / methylmalonate-semialdehyde dehydrogenase
VTTSEMARETDFGHPPGEARNYVGGRWLDGDDVTLETRDPATGTLLATVPASGPGDVEKAVAAARAAQPEWGKTSPLVRARALFRFRDVLDRHRDELASLVTRDMGKTRSDAAAEIQRGIESVEAASAVPHLLQGETLGQVGTDVDTELRREPVGVAAAITAFNFPAMIPLWFLPFAVGCGNSFVLKPSEQDPLASQRMFQLIDELEIFPAGVVNLVHGGRETVDALLDHPGVDAFSFVGSAATARYVYRRASENGKRVQALGGAKNALVVMPDADPVSMADGVASSAFGGAGQRCLAGSILVLVGSKDQQDASLATVVDVARRLVTGDGGEPATDVCPLISPEARMRLEGEIETALQGGAELVLDGRCDGGAGGAQLGPTIIDGAGVDSRAVQEELFGPVLTVVRVADLDGAIEVVNRSRYGNAAMIFTSLGSAARAFREGAHAGMLGVNVGVAAPVAWFPFGGWKDSFQGDLHANGKDAVRFFTRVKVVTSRWP